MLLGGIPLSAGEPPVSFSRDVMAVLSKSGCNMGACHGNQNGKGGFKLSLRGEDPEFDFLALTREQSGRRLNLAEAAASLVLRKPTQQLAHEGGRRFAVDSPEYQLVHDWIAAGAPHDAGDLPRLTGLDVAPRAQILVAPESQVQLNVTATFADGSRRDVTRLAVYEPSNTGVTITPQGLVERTREGETTVLVRYLAQQVPVRLAFVAGGVHLGITA